MAPPRAPRAFLRFAVPPSVGPDAERRAAQLGGYLKRLLGDATEIALPETYEQLAKELLGGRVDAAWAPPFVCARIEAMGVRVLVRGVRNGSSTYRAALISRKSDALTLEQLAGKRAAWSDRDAVAGFLLPGAFLREKGKDPARTFSAQEFKGSYRAALEAVLAGQADVTSVFAPSQRSALDPLSGIAEVWPERAHEFALIACTDEAPNDGVAVSMASPAPVVAELEKALLAMHQSPEGQQVLAECFHAERFEVAPRMGYRALYRVALASL
jgi:phosphonate transport system substrate-binding protein